MDSRKVMCKCTNCKNLFIDTIPNDRCLRIKEDELPKRVRTLIEEGCPECESWDHLEDVFDEVVIVARNIEEAKNSAAKLYPDALFLKALNSNNSTRKGTNTLLNYLFLR